MPLFCLPHGNGHLIFPHQPPAMSLIHTRAILHPDLMSPDPVGAQPWGCRCFWALWSDVAVSRWFSHGCCQHILRSRHPNGSAGGSAVTESRCGWRAPPSLLRHGLCSRSGSPPAPRARAWEGLQPPNQGALGAAECGVNLKAPVPKVILGEVLCKCLLHIAPNI